MDHINYEEFFTKKNVVAMVGVSTDHNKWGWKVYHTLKHLGYEVYPVNPKHKEIDGERCYPNIGSLPKKPDLVITVVPPQITEKVVEECKALGVKKVWMQPGSESEKAIEFCKKNEIKLVYNACFVMDGLGEKFH